MAGVTWTRTTTRQVGPSSGQIEGATLRAMDALGKVGVQEIRSKIWAVRRFKRPTGKSTAAWTYRLGGRGGGVYSVTFLNPAVSKYGTNYPRYVHLAGRPKSDLLMFEVDAYAAEDLGVRLGKVIQAIYIRLRTTAPKVRVTERI